MSNAANEATGLRASLPESNKDKDSPTPFVYLPQHAPGAATAKSGTHSHNTDSSIPLSIFPISMDKFVICFAGLPGRGKTHTARRLARYLEFFHACPVKLFNFNEYRRQKLGPQKNMFFDHANSTAREQRQSVYNEIFTEATSFLNSNSNGVVILDSTNSTIERRASITNMMHSQGAKMLFIELYNDDSSSVEMAYRDIVEHSPDYYGMDAQVAWDDFKSRVKLYEQIYEEIDSSNGRSNHSASADPGSSGKKEGSGKEESSGDGTEGSAPDAASNSPVPSDPGAPLYINESKLSYIKCNLNKRSFIIHNVSGYLQQKIAHFIMNLNTNRHNFYLTRHGQSDYNAHGRIGGDSGLSDHGRAYAHKLAHFVEHTMLRSGSKSNSAGADPGSGVGEGGDEGARVAVPGRLWTSTMRRTRETAQFIQSPTIKIQDRDDPSLVHEWVQMRARAWHHLDELFAGTCDGMTYEEIEAQMPEEFSRRQTDKLAYRYPRGESYLDVIARLEPMIIEMERHREPLLIVGHQGILRIMYAFYMGLSREEAPYVSIPLNTVVQLQPGAFSCKETRHTLYTITRMPKDGQDEPLALKLERESQQTSDRIQSHCTDTDDQGAMGDYQGAVGGGSDDHSASSSNDHTTVEPDDASSSSSSISEAIEGAMGDSQGAMGYSRGAMGGYAVDPKTMSVPVLERRERGLSIDELNNPSSH